MKDKSPNKPLHVSGSVSRVQEMKVRILVLVSLCFVLTACLTHYIVDLPSSSEAAKERLRPFLEAEGFERSACYPQWLQPGQVLVECWEKRKVVVIEIVEKGEMKIIVGGTAERDEEEVSRKLSEYCAQLSPPIRAIVRQYQTCCDA